jgi:hypothetical protein
MIPSYSKRLARIQLRTSQNASRLTASRSIGLATALLKAPSPPSSFFCITGSQLYSTSSLSRNPKHRPTNTPQNLAQTPSSLSQLSPSHVHQRHLRPIDRLLNSPRTANFSPRLSATLHNQVLRHLQPSPPGSRTTYYEMSTLSQPQTPATADSPLREHRHSPVQTVTDQLETPSLDDRQYRVIKLENQLEVLLVQDADTDKASAAMDVNVGNFNDPPELPGMCHIVEHMLFMGTKKVRDLL